MEVPEQEDAVANPAKDVALPAQSLQAAAIRMDNVNAIIRL